MIKKILFSLFILCYYHQDITSQINIFEFTKVADVSSWYIVNDDVMGGVSSSYFDINKDGNAVFNGEISLENNGGFASIRHVSKPIFIGDKTTITVNLKGDGKEYQLRIKANNNDYYSFVKTFKTSGNWELINIKLKDMYSTYRGRKLDMNNFNDNYFEQITFLIGNKRKEKFQLLIKEITLN